MELQVKTEMKILKPAHDVFEAIVDPDKMARYFISKGSGPLEAGRIITWTWVERGNTMCDVRVLRVDGRSLISFLWSGSGFETLVEIRLLPAGPGQTLVKVVEDGWDRDEQGIACFVENVQGWVGFLCGLKIFVEDGISLRP